MTLQLFIILLYFVITIIIGIIAQRKSNSAATFHGMGLGVTTCVCAATGEWLGGSATTGVAEYGFDIGIAGAMNTITNALGIFVLAIFFVKMYRGYKSITVPGIIGKLLGDKAKKTSSWLLIFVMVAVGISQMIAAGSLAVSVMDINFKTAVASCAVVFIIYTLLGGMNAVAYTNVLHLMTMYFGAVVALVLALRNVGGYSVVTESLPESYFNFTTVGYPQLLSWTIASVLGACTAQAGLQPVFAAKSDRVARKASVITALIVAPFGILSALLGMTAKTMSLKGTLLNASGELVTVGKLALPTLMMTLSPLVGGILLASILAAVLSTVSPLILSSGTMYAKDIYALRHPGTSDKKLLLVSRAATAVAGVVMASLAIILNALNMRVLDIVYVGFTMRAALFIILMLAIKWKRTSERATIYAMIGTIVVGVFWVSYKAVTGHNPISTEFTETYAAIITAFVIIIVCSYIFPNKREIF